MASVSALATASDMRYLIVFLILMAVSITPIGVLQAQQFVSQEDFLASAFSQAPVTRHLLWLNQKDKDAAKSILGHPYGGMRIRYWSSGDRIAWVLDEVGKEEPITVGVVTEGDRITGVKILAFRESRGGEVRYESFTRQFIGARLDERDRLDSHIDGITGATLSVNAVTRVTEWSLYLSKRINPGLPSGSGVQVRGQSEL